MQGGSSRRELIDPFGRRINYVRLSVTDRCDLRCRYCMAETMVFESSDRLLTAAEIINLADRLIARGVRRIRLTGGEPLVRRDIDRIVSRIGERVGDGLDELTLTTNGTQLGRHADMLRRAGVRRVNVSLDTRDPERFRFITRRGDLRQVLAGVDAAANAGLRIKINMVALAGINADETDSMLNWCIERDFDLTLIETMPLGDVDLDRAEHYLSLATVRATLMQSHALIPTLSGTGGPARTYIVDGTTTRVGFITPLSDNFCGSCNRIRITATGTVFGCLGHGENVELRGALRNGDAQTIDALLDQIIAAKPRRHDFDIARKTPAQARHMSVTGG